MTFNYKNLHQKDVSQVWRWYRSGMVKETLELLKNRNVISCTCADWKTVSEWIEYCFDNGLWKLNAKLKENING